MALTELRAAQLLVRRYYGRIPPDEESNLPALCGYVDLSPPLKQAFNKGFARREVRDQAELAVIVRNILSDASIVEPGAQYVAGEAALRLLCRAFNLNAASHASFKEQCREIVRRAQALPKPLEAPPTRISKRATSSPVSATTPSPQPALPPNAPTSPSSATVSTPTPVAIDAQKPPAINGVSSEGEVGTDATTASPHSLFSLQADLVLARAAPQLEGLSAAIKHTTDARGAWGASPLEREQLENLRSALETVRDAATRARDALPTTEELLTQDAERHELTASLSTDGRVTLAADAYQLLRDQRDWPSIVQASRLMASLNSAQFPAWIWPEALPEEYRGSPIGRAIALRRDAVLADDLSRCLEWLSSYSDDERRRITQLTQPTSGGTAVQRLQLAWNHAEQFRAVRARLEQRLAAAADMYSQKTLDRISQDEDPEALLDRADEYRDRLLRLKDHVHTSVFAELREELQALEATFTDTLSDLEAVLSQYGPTVLGGFISVESVRALAVAQAPSQPRVTTSPERATAAIEVKFDHPLSKQAGRSTNVHQAVLCFYRPDLSSPFGFVTLPIRMTIHPAPETPVRALLEVEGDLISGQPKEWHQFITPRAIEIPAGAARIDLKLTIPMTRDRATSVHRREKSLSLRLRASGEGLTTASAEAMTWRDLVLELPAMKNPFPGSLQLDLMLRRPLGVEKHFTALSQLVRDGDRSFIVTAPRRYGKTWLLEAITRKARDYSNVFVIDDVVASGRDLAAVWNLLAERLQKQFDRPVPAELEAGLVPIETAYDAVRREAFRKGYRTLYLLIDEAQAFFAHPQARRLSERLKERLEKSWGTREGERAAVRMGFVGQAHLPKLIGGNLLGAIPAVFENVAISEDDLLEVLRDAATEGGLQSSAEARRRLTALAGNLWVLDKLLEGVSQRCIGMQHPWFLDEDVDAVADAMVEAYRNRKDDTLWRYVRDVLNESDDLDKWIPSETFPAAMALARAREDNLPPTELAPRVEQVLRSWARDLEVLPDRVSQALERLRDARVVDRELRFEIPMLERLLAVRGREDADPFEDEAEREALDRLGLTRVRRPLPPDDESDARSGGQATVYRATDDGQDVAVRCIRLATQISRRRFMSELTLLERLNEVSPTSTSDWTDAYSHVPKVVRSGLADDDTSLGVVIYQWIHGHPLKEKTLSEDAAIGVGRCLSSVLQLLTELDVVHRDIRPQNVLLRSPRWTPVLIDFGLARAVIELTSGPDTLAGVPEYIPPEVVNGGSQKWSAAGDVFSLGQTLTHCLRATPANTGLGKLLTAMTASNPLTRPSSKQIYEEFRSMEEAARLETQKKDSMDRIGAHIRTLPQQVQVAAERAKTDVWACQSGLVGDQEQRLTMVAEFLENVFGRYVNAKRELKDAFERQEGTRLRWVGQVLQRIQDKDLKRLDAPCAVAVAHLRNANAHSNEFDKHVNLAYKAIKVTRPLPERRGTDRALQTAVQDVAQRLGALYHSGDAIRRYVDFWLGLIV